MPKCHSGVLRQLRTLEAEGGGISGMRNAAEQRIRLPVRLGEARLSTPDHIVPPVLQAVIEKAGMVAGLGDFRPVFGRFEVVRFEVVGV